jgi:hypothetical protein
MFVREELVFKGMVCLCEEEDKIVVGGGFCLLVLVLYFDGTKFFTLALLLYKGRDCGALT